MKGLERLGMDIKREKYNENAVYGLACVYSFLEKEISGYLGPYGLSPAKFNALMVIKHKGKEEGISQVEIGRNLIVTASNMTRLLDRLEKEGLIERSSQKGDRRVNLVKISKKGSDILDGAWPGYCRKIAELSNLLKKEELRQMSGLILKWYGKLEEKTNV